MSMLKLKFIQSILCVLCVLCGCNNFSVLYGHRRGFKFVFVRVHSWFQSYIVLIASPAATASDGPLLRRTFFSSAPR